LSIIIQPVVPNHLYQRNVKNIMATTNKTASSKPATKTAAKAAATATPPTVVAKGKRGFAALAEGVPGLRSAKPAAAAKAPARKASKAELKVDAKKPSLKRSAAAKRAEPTGAKKPDIAKNHTTEDGLPQHEVKNLKGLRAVMDQYPKATHFSTDIKFGTSIVHLLNLRGRKLAEVKLAK
jgi:hypothetical protein